MSTRRSFVALLPDPAPDRAAVVDHTVYARVSTLDDVRALMEAHVFAVWNFMSLLKSLQRELTCVDVPWVPKGDAEARRLVHEVVVGEEYDDNVAGVVPARTIADLR